MPGRGGKICASHAGGGSWARTTIGRQIYAVGGNEKAAKLSGIKTERLTFLTFVNMGVLAALAGLVFAARLNTATPKAGAASSSTSSPPGSSQRLAGVNGACPLVMTGQPDQHDRQAMQQ